MPTRIPRQHRPSGLLAAGLILASPYGVLAAEPLCDWLDGLGGAASAEEAGAPAEALAAAERASAALPRGQAGVRAQLAAGLARRQLGQPAAALLTLPAALDTAAPAGRTWLQLAMGQALLEAGQVAEAGRVLGEAAQIRDLVAGRRARWLECQVLLAAGRPALAAPRLEALLSEASDDPAAPRGRLQLAAASQLLGQGGRALTLYRGLALEEPDLPESASALEALARWRSAGRAGAEITAEDHLLRAERLLTRGRPAEALAEIELATAARPAASAPRTTLLRALVLLAQGRPGEAASLVTPLVESGAAGVRRGAAFVLARSAGRAGRHEESSRWYTQVAASVVPVPGLPEARWRDLGDEAAYLAAWTWLEAGDLRRAVVRLEAFARTHPGSLRADDARWFAAWARLRLGDREEARRALRRLERSSLADAALYWSARLEPEPAAAQGLYRRVGAAGAEGWYGALARARLAPLAASHRGGEGSGEGAAGLPLTLPAGPSGRRLLAAAELLAMGWREAAVAELVDLARRPTSRAVAAPLAELAAYAGLPELAFRVARDRLGATPQALRWLFPAQLTSTLEGQAAATAVDPDLVRALVRRESGFRAGARSAAGAIGLTQLVPSTARRVASLAGVEEDPTPRLLDPELSVGLGAHYLGLLLDRFGDEAVAVAAYNAGPTTAAAWARERSGQPLDEWVESIPYKETRAYVKSVLAGREAYRRLGGRPPALDPGRAVPAPGSGVGF